MSASICPCCGYDLEKDAPSSFAGISMAPYGRASFNGEPLSLTRSETGILWALVKARGIPLSRAVLAERIGYEGDHNVVDVFLTRIKKSLSQHGGVPIRNIRGIGVYLEGAHRDSGIVERSRDIPAARVEVVTLP